MTTILDRDDTSRFDIPMWGGVGTEIHRPGGPRETARACQLAEELGYAGMGFSDQLQSWIFRSVWSPDLVPAAARIADHEAFYDTLPLISACAMVTSRIRLGTVIDCYRRPPSLLAQTLNTLDHLSEGRVFIHIGTGENKQFLPYGLERTEPRNARLEEFIRTVKILMASQDPVTLPDNRFWPMRDALVALPPYREGRTVSIIMVGGGPRAMRIAARVADGIGTYIPGAFGDSVERYEEDLAVFWAEVERVGRDPKTVRARAFDQVILCENDAQVDEAVRSPFTRSLVLNLTPTGKTWREAWGVEHPLGDDWALSVTHRSTMFGRDELLRIIEPVTPDVVQRMILVGTPEDVAARTVPWLRAAGTKHVPLTHGSNFSTTLFPDQLLPAADGLPRWHHLAVRYTAELNRLLSSVSA